LPNRLMTIFRMKYNFLVIEGNIGAGKTSLSKRISQQFNAKLILEQFAENPFLPKFYEEPDKYSFQLELSFLADRFHQLNQDLTSGDLFKSFTLSDYYFTKSLIFSKCTLPNEEYKLYRKIFNIIYSSLPKPDLYVYLHLHVDNCIKNIKKRGRDYEQSISPEYLHQIQDGYLEYLKSQKDLKILIIDTNNLDFVNNQEQYDQVIHAIFEKEYSIGINTLFF